MASSDQKNSYMDFNICLMRLVFIWPLKTKNLCLIFLQRSVTWITLIILTFVSIVQLLKMCVSLDLQELSSTVDVFTLTASALYKMIYLLRNIHILQAMVKVVHTKFEERPLGGIDKFNMTAHIRPTRLLSILYIMSGQFTAVVWCFAPLLLSALEPVTDPSAPLTLKNRKTMPMNIWLPFNIAESPLYEFFFVIETFGFSVSAVLYLTIDSFYFFLIYVICGQLELIDASFRALSVIEERMRLEQEERRVRERSIALRNNNQLTAVKEIPALEEDKSLVLYRHKVLNDHMDRIVDLHATTLELIRVIEIFFSQAIVVDFLHAILSLSFALFQTQMSVTFMEMVKMYVFIVVCIVHQFFNNFFGENLIHAQHMIVNSVYQSPWYTGDRKFKKSVQMITIRSHCPIKLSGFKMYILCLQSFLEFCRRIFSYYTVLSEVSAQ